MSGTGNRFALDAGQNASIADFFNSISSQRSMPWFKCCAAHERSFAALEAHLARWTREIADQRVHGTTGEAPMSRYARHEAGMLKPLPQCGAFLAMRDLSRRVASDCAVEFDTNSYSVPWRLIGERVRVLVASETVRITHAGVEVACHRRSGGRRARIIDHLRFAGVAGAPRRRCCGPSPVPSVALALMTSALARSRRHVFSRRWTVRTRLSG